MVPRVKIVVTCVVITVVGVGSTRGADELVAIDDFFDCDVVEVGAT